MSTDKICPQCGNTAAFDAPGGLCAACLLKPGLEPPLDSMNAQTTPFARHFTAPAVKELAPLFPDLEIIQLLGQGGMGAVYQARQLRLDRLVALKILPKVAGQEAEFATRFAREARAMARLNHPNIVNIHDYGDKAGWFFFIMEYVDGVNLRQAIQAKSIEPKEALSIVGQVCDALQYAHQEGVVHRDIKPENILLDKRGRIKIADFGLAKLLGSSTLTRNLTATNQVMGTVGYMAPEQMEGSKLIDHRADLYAVGVVFYELLTGELPLGRFAPPSHKVQIDVRLDEVVLKTLEKEPDRRYQHASLIKQDVEQISRGPMLSAPVTTPPPKTMVEMLPWLKNPTAAGAALLVLGLLEFGLFFLGMLQMTELRLGSVGNRSWIIFTMADLFAGIGVAFAGLLILWRRLWFLAVLGTLVAMAPLAQMSSLLRPADEESTLSQLINLAEKQGIKFNPTQNEANAMSYEARALRDRILNMGDHPENSVNKLVYARWPTTLVTWLSIPAGLWAFLLLLRPEVKSTFGRIIPSLISRSASRNVEPVAAKLEESGGERFYAVGFNGLLAVLGLGLGAAFVIWIGSAFLSGQRMRIPFDGRDAGETAWIFAPIGLGLIWMGIMFFNSVMQRIQTSGLNTTHRSQFIFLTLLFLSCGLILLFIVLRVGQEDSSLAYNFRDIIIHGSEAAGWIAGFLVGGGIALVLALSPIDQRKAWQIAKWAGVVLVIGAIIYAIIAPSTVAMIRVNSP